MGWDSHDIVYEFTKLCNKKAVLVLRLEYYLFSSSYRKTK
jgi:hypothetical protein